MPLKQMDGRYNFDSGLHNSIILIQEHIIVSMFDYYSTYWI